MEAAPATAAEIRNESGREAFVAMMQATDLRERDDSSNCGRLNWAQVRAILIERKMSPRE